MAIRIKIAKTAKELDDVYRLRYKVYVEGEGYFKDLAGKTERIIDHFDAVPKMANIIAYSDDTPIATIRINSDTDILLPSDEIFDFSDYRNAITKLSETTLIVSAGMLAIDIAWRNRRDIFQALFKMCADIGTSWGATHVISTINIRSVSIYGRLGFTQHSDEIWIPDIGESIVAMTNEFSTFYTWAFGQFSADYYALITHFSGHFEYLLTSADTTIFNAGEESDTAYLIGRGEVKISYTDEKSKQSLHLATLQAGELFGELSLIDGQLRSANAIAQKNTELIVLHKKDFLNEIYQDPIKIMSVLNIFCNRIRELDKKVFIYAHASMHERLDYFLNQIKQTASLSKDKQKQVAKITLEDFAFMASVSIEETENYLQHLAQQQKIAYQANKIIFYTGV